MRKVRKRGRGKGRGRGGGVKGRRNVVRGPRQTYEASTISAHFAFLQGCYYSVEGCEKGEVVGIEEGVATVYISISFHLIVFLSPFLFIVNSLFTLLIKWRAIRLIETLSALRKNVRLYTYRE